MFLTLRFYVSPDHFNRYSTGCYQTETLTPESFLPQLLSNLREFFFQESAAGTLISIDKLAAFTLRLSPEHHMDMITVMVPLIHLNAIPCCDIRKDFPGTVRNSVTKNIPSVFHNQNKVMIQQKNCLSYRLSILYHNAHYITRTNVLFNSSQPPKRMGAFQLIAIIT